MNYLTWTILYILLTNIELCNAQLNGEEEKCSGEICIPPDYNKLRLPVANSTNNITISILDLKILKIDDNDCIVKTSFWIQITWLEPRLISPYAKFKNEITQDYYYQIDESYHKYLWLPDIFIWNLENIELRRFLNNEREILYYPNGTLLLQTNLVLDIFCPMTFETYPIDNHTCDVYFLSFGYNVTDVNLSIGTIHTREIVNLLDYSFEIEAVPPGSQSYFEVLRSYTGFNINLERNIYKYIWNYYIPSGLLVSISWVSILWKIMKIIFYFFKKKNSCYFYFFFLKISFVIPQDVVPGRIALLITIFLVMINIFITVTAKSPHTESLTNISTWIITCIIFVYSALVEYGFLLFYRQVTRSFDTVPPQYIKNALKKVDLVCLGISMSVFFVFNVAFWSHYHL